jgi:hypothetical protein
MMTPGRYEESLGDFLYALWQARRHIVLFSLVFLALSFLLTLMATPLYRASMIVAPADGYALGDYASSVADQDSLAIPFWRPREADGVSTDFHRFTYTMKGPAVAAILLKDNAVLSGIARDKAFSKASGDWTAEELSAYLEKTVRIQNLGATPLRKILYTHPDPAFASSFLRKIHLVSDQLIRRDRRRQSESRIRYLQETLQKTLNPDHRRGIASLLMQQEHIQMLANLDEPYAAIIVEPASAIPRPVWPNKWLICALGFFLGGAAEYFAHIVQKNKK